MNKKFVNLFIFVLLVSFSKEALAGTDVLCNVLTTINTTLKEVGEVQNKISGKVREITSLKISPASLLSAVGGDKLMASAEKIKERAENLKEKAEKVKEFAENAKEKKEELMAKYQELNALATEKFAQANEAFAKAKALYEEYEGKYQEIKGKVQEGMAIAQDVVAAGTAAVAVVQGIKEGGAAALGSQVASSLGLENVSAAIKGAQAEVQATPVTATETEMTKIENTAITEVSTNIQADTISSATRLADQVVKENQKTIEAPKVDVLERNEVNISTKDIMKGVSELKQKPEIKEEGLKSNINLKDQLTDSVNKPLKVSDDKKLNKVSLSEKGKQLENIQTRAKFGEVKKADVKAVEINETLLEKVSLQDAKTPKKLNKESLKATTADKLEKISAVSAKSAVAKTQAKASEAQKVSAKALKDVQSLTKKAQMNKIVAKEKINAK